MKPRKSLNRLLAGATVGTLLALGFGVIPAQAQTQVSTEVRDIYNMTNNVRSAYGLNTLTLDTSLTNIAQDWSNTQARENRMYHRPNFANGYPAGWQWAAENVVSGSKSLGPNVLFDAWMKSQGHKDNILSRNATHIGVGWASNGSNNFSTQNFGKYSSNPTPAIDPNVSTPPVNASFNHRIGVISNGQYFVKEGASNAGWTNVWGGNVKAVAVTQNRIGVLLNGGELFVKEGGVSAGWVLEGTGVTDFALANNRIGVISNGSALVKEGNLYAGWVTVQTNARDIALNGNRIGVITNDNTLHVKEGAVNAGWVVLAHHVKDVVLNESRVGIHDASNTLYVKEGALNSGWTNVAANISSFDLSGNRIGVVRNGTAFAKEGSVSAGWVTLDHNTSKIELSGNRVIVINSANQAVIKEGTLYAGWVVLANGVSAVDMNNS